MDNNYYLCVYNQQIDPEQIIKMQLYRVYEFKARRRRKSKKKIWIKNRNRNACNPHKTNYIENESKRAIAKTKWEKKFIPKQTSWYEK